MATTKKTTTKKSTNTTKKTTKQTTPTKVTKKQPIKKETKVVEQIKPEDNKKLNLKKIYIIIIIALSILLLISTTIELVNIFTPSENLLPTAPPQETISQEEKDNINKLFSEDIDLSLAKKENNNDEIVGRIEIPGVFNLLLTQTKDNDYYIEYNIKRKRSNKGTEFVDFRTKLTDKQINVYGHNSRLYELPFKNLEKFLEKDFFDQNEYILLQHEEGRRIYRIISIKRVTTDYEHMTVETTKKTHVSHIEKLLSNSTYQRDIKYDENTNLLVLQTCTREKNVQAFYVLTAFEVDAK
jgi:sortase B